MNLAHLSIVHCPPRSVVPVPMANEERLRALRSALPAEIGNNVFRFNGANAQADAPVEIVPLAVKVKDLARTDPRPEIAQPEISTGRPTLNAGSRPTSPVSPDGAAPGTYTHTAAPAVAAKEIDPFDCDWTFEPMTDEEGTQYEREETLSGRDSRYVGGFLVE